MKWMFGASPPPNLLNDDGSASNGDGAH